MAGQSGYGASGVVYSAIGICAASAIINTCTLLVKYVRSFRDPGSKEITVPELFTMALNLLLLAFTLYLTLFARESFLNVSPGVDVFAHTAGFLIYFALGHIDTVPYAICPKKETKDRKRPSPPDGRRILRERH